MAKHEDIRRSIHITGDALAHAGAELAAAWKAAAAGEAVPPTDRLYFDGWEAVCAVLTPRRYALLRHLHHAPADSIRALARSLGRDIKRVHADVTALEEVGLIERDEAGRLTVPVDEIVTAIRFAA